jgi:hypothetical protein
MINSPFIDEMVTEADYIEYDEDFKPLPSNNKRMEEAFQRHRGRRMNAEEYEHLKAALETRRAADKAFLDEIAVEKCHEHKELMMYQATLDDGLEAAKAAVKEDVDFALSTKGIAFEYKVAAHPESDAVITEYAVAAIEVSDRNDG